MHRQCAAWFSIDLNVEFFFLHLRFYLAARGPAASLLQVLLVVLRQLGVVRLLVARRACAARRAGLASGASAGSNGRGSGRARASSRRHGGTHVSGGLAFGLQCMGGGGGPGGVLWPPAPGRHGPNSGASTSGTSV